MVDHQARKQLSEAIRHFGAGVMTVDAFESVCNQLRKSSRDNAVHAIPDEIWRYYDDYKTVRLRGIWQLAPNTRDVFARCVLFLKTDAEFCRPQYSFNFLVELFITLAVVISFGALSRRIEQERRRRSAAFGEIDVWPFHTLAEYDAARQMPSLLTGAR